jgi:hypothetical protein
MTVNAGTEGHLLASGIGERPVCPRIIVPVLFLRPWIISTV